MAPSTSLLFALNCAVHSVHLLHLMILPLAPCQYFFCWCALVSTLSSDIDAVFLLQHFSRSSKAAALTMSSLVLKRVANVEQPPSMLGSQRFSELLSKDLDWMFRSAREGLIESFVCNGYELSCFHASCPSVTAMQCNAPNHRKT